MNHKTCTYKYFCLGKEVSDWKINTADTTNTAFDWCVQSLIANTDQSMQSNKWLIFAKWLIMFGLAVLNSSSLPQASKNFYIDCLKNNSRIFKWSNYWTELDMIGKSGHGVLSVWNWKSISERKQFTEFLSSTVTQCPAN